MTVMVKVVKPWRVRRERGGRVYEQYMLSIPVAVARRLGLDGVRYFVLVLREDGTIVLHPLRMKEEAGEGEGGEGVSGAAEARAPAAPPFRAA